MLGTNQEHNETVLWLTDKIVGLNIEATFDKLEEGPILTSYFFKLGSGTSVRKMINLGEDFALAIGKDNVNIQRIQGHIVVQVPNKIKKLVEYKDYLHWYLHDEEVDKMAIPLPLGIDIKGKRSAFDLAEGPHLLVAGATGGGKSVWLSATIASLAYKLDPSELELYLVDTKKVDLPLFKKLPHVKQVVDDLMPFHHMMSKIMPEIRRRLSRLQGSACRNIGEYHRLGYFLPYIVVILDEFADLMDIDSATRKAAEDKDVIKQYPSIKMWIKQLVQIGRAAGVHLIAATQRSSVKVVDGDIKANLPCRISFRLPTGTDSRTILGTNGAENLLGKGDMLVQRPETDTVERYHGPYVSMNDIAELINNYEIIKATIGG